MFFMVAAYLKPGAEEQLISFSDDLSEHFEQSSLKIAGALRDPDGRRRGYLGFVEAKSFSEAEAFVQEGPFYQKHLYERLEIFRYDLEVGQFA